MLVLLMRRIVVLFVFGAGMTTSAIAACTATYTTRNDWSTGFVMETVLTNSGKIPISGWQVSWTYNKPIRLVNAQWSGRFHITNEKTVSVVDNGVSILAPGASIVFGAAMSFNGEEKPIPDVISITAKGCGEFYVNPDSNAARWVKSHRSDPRAAVIQDVIVKTAAATWFTGGAGDIARAVDNYVSRADALNQMPILVAYNIPTRDCGGASAGGASSSLAYQSWIQAFAQAIDTRQAIVILEPDALADAWAPMHCFAKQLSQTQATRLALLSYAIAQFNRYAPNALVYLDAGNSKWLPATDAASLLISAGIMHAHGFSLNVSNFQSDTQLIAYGKAVNAILQKQLGVEKPFVIDTSRNGNGPMLDKNGATVWCDPAARKIGIPSTRYPAGSIPEMRLWIKLPGNTDGCAMPDGMPTPYAAGTFVPEIAYNLIFGY